MEYSNFDPSYYENHELRVNQTKIPGLLYIDLVVNGDDRGWFKEGFQRDKLVGLGFPDTFNIVQLNISSNRERGVTRGIHAEPWNKFITVTRGLAFAAIVDFRESASFGTVETFELNPQKALFVPKGCGNSYQTLTENVDYAYLVDAHWSPEASYTHVNLADPSLGINWPIPLAEAIVSDKDVRHPALKDITPFKETK